jgi:hypothetical protein
VVVQETCLVQLLAQVQRIRVTQVERQAMWLVLLAVVVVLAQLVKVSVVELLVLVAQVFLHPSTERQQLVAVAAAVEQTLVFMALVVLVVVGMVLPTVCLVQPTRVAVVVVRVETLPLTRLVLVAQA